MDIHSETSVQAAHNFVWIDLEMTGLNPKHDTILEIATIITDAQLNIIATGPDLIINQPEHNLQNLDPWVLHHHTKSGLLQAVRASTVTLLDAEEQTLAFIERYCIKGSAYLAGNSVWQDRAFLVPYMPRIIEYLHYRLIDVTTIKELVKRWYPHDSTVTITKKDAHRAGEDIMESIKELQHYRAHFFR